VPKKPPLKPVLTAAKVLEAHARGFPEVTSVDTSWGRTFKVRGKPFLYLVRYYLTPALGFSAKLPESGAEALRLAFVKPTAFGLGAKGWVTAYIESLAGIPLDVLRGWIDESYRAVAPAELTTGAPTPRPAKRRKR
jgi:hypothetical protein